MTDGRASVNAGDSLSYKIVVTNNGPSPANRISVTGTFTEGYGNFSTVYTTDGFWLCNIDAYCDYSSISATADGFTLEGR